MSTSSLPKQNKLTTEQAIGIAVGVIMTILVMAVIGMLSVFCCFVVKKKKSKLIDIVLGNIDVTSEKNTTVVYKNHINSTTTLYNNFSNSKNSKDIYEKINKQVLDYNS